MLGKTLRESVRFERGAQIGAEADRLDPLSTFSVEIPRARQLYGVLTMDGLFIIRYLIDCVFVDYVVRR